MNSEPAAQRTGRTRGTIAAGVTVGLVAVAFGWQAVTNDATAEPDPSTTDQTSEMIETFEADGSESPLGNGFEWIINEPAVDLADLAEIHATSRLQYDECQQDYADVAGEPSSSRNPLYFC